MTFINVKIVQDGSDTDIYQCVTFQDIFQSKVVRLPNLPKFPRNLGIPKKSIMLHFSKIHLIGQLENFSYIFNGTFLVNYQFVTSNNIS